MVNLNDGMIVAADAATFIDGQCTFVGVNVKLVSPDRSKLEGIDE
jgi:hypothetical protein